MIVTQINDFEVIRKIRSKYVVRIFFDRKWRKHECFWLSEKQYLKLNQSVEKVRSSNVKNTIVLAVFDNDRFVWSGVEYPDYSDREWLEKTFNAESCDTYTIEKPIVESHIPDKVETIQQGPDEELIR